MSRSFKKHPGWCDRSPWAKRQANQKLRHCEDVPDGNAYRKFTDPWEIHDYKSIIWGKMDLRYVDDDLAHYVPRGLPKPVRCLKELKETLEYRRARMK